MRTSATITFHASHNYGYMLKAYALQQTIKGLRLENKLMNLRTEKQRELYPNPTNIVGIKIIVLGTCFPKYKYDISQKYVLFENFIKNRLDCTTETTDISDINKLNFNY